MIKTCFSVGDRIRVRLDAKLPKKLSYACCCTGVVTRVAKFITVQLDPTKNFEAHCLLVKPECLEHWPGQICVAESVPVSPTPDACTRSSTSSPPATPTTIAKISCSSDIQEPSASEMFDCGHRLAKAYQPLNWLPPVPLVSPSPFRESDWALRTKETVSQPLLERSPTQHLDSGVLRMSPDSSVVLSDQERELGHISLLSSVKWPSSGTMSSGVVSRADTLLPPGVGNDCSWLGSHGALSHTSRAPGLSKSESTSRAKGILGKDEVYNPDWLELSSGLPLGYSSPSELRTATELLESEEKRSATPSTPEWQKSPFVESYTSTASPNPLELNPLELNELRSRCAPSCTCPSCASPLLTLKKGCGVCGWMPSQELVLGETENPLALNPQPVLGETTKRRASGWLEHYTKNKKLKSGLIATYPRCEGERDPDNPDHWYWAYRWEEKQKGAKSDNGCVTRAVSLPREKVQAVSLAIARDWPVKKILSFITSQEKV